ncbi:MAG: virulence factor [Aestuariivirgaceae bacterium]
MAQLVVTYWRDIPSQVVVKAGRTAEKRMLSERFQEAIDMAAMRGGAAQSDDYLEEWRRGEPVECNGDFAEEVDKACAALEAEYDKERLKTLIGNEGWAQLRP